MFMCKEDSYRCGFISDKCSFLQCRDDEMCVVENGKFKCKVTEDKSNYIS